MGPFIDAFYDQRNMVQENIKMVYPMVKEILDNNWYDDITEIVGGVALAF